MIVQLSIYSIFGMLILFSRKGVLGIDMIFSSAARCLDETLIEILECDSNRTINHMYSTSCQK